MKNSNALSAYDILEFVNEIAPPELAEDWDNIGLLVGGGEMAVSGIVVCLDVTEEVIERAVSCAANLIISHHPVIFKPVKSLSDSSIPYLLASNNIACISAHTNLDNAAGGTNDLLAARLSLNNVRIGGDGVCRVGDLEKAMTPAEFAAYAAERLSIPAGAVMMSCGLTGSAPLADRLKEAEKIKTVAVCGGSGGDYIYSALAEADCYLTGELGYHYFDMMRGYLKKHRKAIVCAGHYYTEILLGGYLEKRLKERFSALFIEFFDGGNPFEIF